MFLVMETAAMTDTLTGLQMEDPIMLVLLARSSVLQPLICQKKMQKQP